MARKFARHKPDQKLVGNLQKIAKLDCSTKNYMISSMMIWFRDEEMKKICQNLVKSMPESIR